MALPVARAAARLLHTVGSRSLAANFLRLDGGSLPLPCRHYAAAAVRAAKKTSTGVKKQQLSKEEKKKPSGTRRPKPFELMGDKPVDDVYMVEHYPKPVYEIETAVEMLKQFQQLDFTAPSQVVYAELRLDMTLEKKKNVEPFVSTINLPYPFTAEMNKVLVFTENAEEAKVAEENGAAFVGGAELIKKILDDEIQADFYIAVPQIVPKLTPLKDKLREKFPKSKRGSVGPNILKMLELFKWGCQYKIVSEHFVRTKIATLDMPSEQIIANVDVLIKDVCTHRPLSYGPFVDRGLICSMTSEALQFKFERFLPQPKEETVSEDSS